MAYAQWLCLQRQNTVIMGYQTLDPRGQYWPHASRQAF